MSLSFDDKILGEKVNNYCSSSDGEGRDSDEGSNNEKSNGDDVRCLALRPITTYSLGNQVAQTGPKGVIADYKQYVKVKEEQDKLKNEMALQMAKQCALTCRPYSADLLAKEQEQKLKDMLEGLIDDDDDAFLAQYRQKRLAEMRGTFDSLPTYSRVYELSTSNFVSEIDMEPPQVTVIVHIYEEIANGVPAILVYKNKEMIGNLISISKELDDFFTPEELETYLFECDVLKVTTVRSGTSKQQNEVED
ncbi:hypothetical protein ACTXT7_004562 [Hymenolepis weldensis]